MPNLRPEAAPTSWWRQENTPGGLPSTNAPTVDAGNSKLMQWGPIEFHVWPLNFHEMDHEVGTDWAHKDIAGAAVYREWVGENDEIRYVRGKIFPYRIGGMYNIELFDSYRRAGVPNLLMGGDGRNLGWFVCEKLIRNHTFISAEGVGQQIAFEAVMARVPVPDPASYIPSIWGAVLSGG